MKYRKLGKYGMRVSSVSLGAWLTYGGTVENQTAISCIHEALNSGVNFIDVADVYARGKAETVVGEALGGEIYRRRDLVVSSKVFWPMSDDKVPSSVNDVGLSRKHIMDSIDDSLDRFGMDYLDIYFLHRYDSTTPLEETIAAMDDLVRDGRIRYWGTSVWSAAQLERAIGVAKEMGAKLPAVEQPRYNMLDRHIELEIMHSTKFHGMGIVPWSPLGGGFLTGKYLGGIPEGSRATNSQFLKNDLEDKEKLEKVGKLVELAKSNEMTMSQMALAWILRRDEITSVITGATKISHVQDNVKASEITLSKDVLDQIHEILDNDPKPHPLYYPAMANRMPFEI
ncbi:MAG: aldo/keto reductase family protein [Candidatus Heimdallarchaeota archaeon]|nr:aldo/keto reductase family protein [Candidatus Heimdallarchaeota archaeon]